MKTIRVLLGLTGLLTLLAIAATPAAAEFQANQPETTQGPYQLSVSSSAVFTSGTAEVKCDELRNGQWHIQTKFTKIGKDAEGATKITQDPTKTGAHQQITGEFTKCIALGTLAATVNTSCSLQVEQSKSGFTGAVKSQCIVTIPAGQCTIFIDPSTANAQLKNVTVVNITGGKEDLSEVNGITSTVTGAGCAVGGITANKENKFKAKGIAHSQKVI